MTARPKYRFDDLRLDAAESAFLSRQLEYIRAELYKVDYPELMGRMLIPVDKVVPPGAEIMTYRQYDRVGSAKVVASYATDAPRVNVFMKEFPSSIRGILTSWGVTIQEMRNAQLAGMNLDATEQEAAREAIEEKIDLIAQVGDSSHGLLGLLNQPNAISYVIPNGVSGSALWKNKTADEILADMNGIISNMVELTNQREKPDTMILPIAQYEEIASRRIGDGSERTILGYFLANSRHVKEVVSWYAVKGAGAGATDRMVIYKRDIKKLKLVIPLEFIQHEPQRKGLQIETICEARCGGVVVHKPLSISYGDGI